MPFLQNSGQGRQIITVYRMTTLKDDGKTQQRVTVVQTELHKPGRGSWLRRKRSSQEKRL